MKNDATHCPPKLGGQHDRVAIVRGVVPSRSMGSAGNHPAPSNLGCVKLRAWNVWDSIETRLARIYGI
jgi:hypothetical protein